MHRLYIQLYHSKRQSVVRPSIHSRALCGLAWHGVRACVRLCHLLQLSLGGEATSCLLSIWPTPLHLRLGKARRSLASPLRREGGKASEVVLPRHKRQEGIMKVGFLDIAGDFRQAVAIRNSASVRTFICQTFAKLNDLKYRFSFPTGL